VNVPVHRITVPLGIVKVTPALTVKFVYWILSSAKDAFAETVLAPAEPSP